MKTIDFTTKVAKICKKKKKCKDCPLISDNRKAICPDDVFEGPPEDWEQKDIQELMDAVEKIEI